MTGQLNHPPICADDPYEVTNESDNFSNWQAMWPARNALRDDIKKWRENSSAKEKSKEDYKKRVDQMERGRYSLDQIRTASTWRKTKYAHIYVWSEKISDAIKEADIADRAKRYSTAIKCIEVAEKYKKMLDKIRSTKMPANLEKKKSKLKLVAKLPANFTDLCFQMAPNGAVKDAVAAMGVAGFRPCEFDHAHGVKASRDGENLKLKVIGAKVKGESQGLEWREVTVVPKSKCALYLFNRCASGEVDIGGVNSDVKSSQWLTDRIRTIGRQLTGRNDITPYVFRHRFATQIKAEWPDDKVSIAISLGHATTKTQATYGYRGGKSNVSPDKIIAINGAKPRESIRVYENGRAYGDVSPKTPSLR